MPKDFELIPHTADIKLRVYGKTMKELFRHALIGMFQSVGPQVPGCHMVDGRVICKDLSYTREIDISSIDSVALLVDFLSEALYLSDIYNEAYFDVHIHDFSDTHIKATLLGAKITGFEVVEIKAVTYHDLSIKQVHGEWVADIVFDI